MSTLDWTLAALAVVSSLGGLTLLFFAWQKRQSPALILGGWAFLLVATALATIANGDRGTAQIIVVMMCVVTALLLFPLLRGATGMHSGTKARTRTNATASRERVSAKGLLGNIWTAILAGPVAGLIAIFASAGLFRVIRPEEGNPATSGIIAIILSVFLWALFSVLMLIESSVLQRTLYAVVGTVLTATLSFV